MQIRTLLTLVLGLGLVTAFGGCDTGPVSPEADSLTGDELSALLSSATEDGPVLDAATDSATERRRDRPGKSVFEQLAEKIPSFGGLYRTRPCSIAVVLTDLSEAERAIETVKSVVEPLVKRACPEGIRVAAVEGKYTYRQLLRVRSALRPLHQIRGVVGAGIDFKQNKVIVAVASREVIDEVRSALRRIGVPLDAVGVVVVDQRTAP